MTKKEGYLSKIFNVSKIFLRENATSNVYSRAEKKAPDFKVSEDHLMLFLAGNLKGNVKLKPLLVYHCQNNGIFKGLDKGELPVIL
jgi:hypothetical protein